MQIIYTRLENYLSHDKPFLTWGRPQHFSDEQAPLTFILVMKENNCKQWII